MIPGEELDRSYDGVTVNPITAIERHIKLAYRAELILQLLKQAGLPFSLFTHEALVMAADALEWALHKPDADEE